MKQEVPNQDSSVSIESPHWRRSHVHSAAESDVAAIAVVVDVVAAAVVDVTAAAAVAADVVAAVVDVPSSLQN